MKTTEEGCPIQPNPGFPCWKPACHIVPEPARSLHTFMRLNVPCRRKEPLETIPPRCTRPMERTLHRTLSSAPELTDTSPSVGIHENEGARQNSGRCDKAFPCPKVTDHQVYVMLLGTDGDWRTRCQNKPGSRVVQSYPVVPSATQNRIVVSRPTQRPSIGDGGFPGRPCCKVGSRAICHDGRCALLTILPSAG